MTRWLGKWVVTCAAMLPALSVALADDPQVEVENPIREWMQSYAEGTVIRLGSAEDAPTAELVEQPVFRYSDVEAQIPDATLWVWTRDSRPVAFQKIEVNAHGGGKLWTICFASLAEDLLEVDWIRDPAIRQRLRVPGHGYAATAPGVSFAPIPDADPPSGAARLRSLQMKRLTERFEGRLRAGGGGSAEIRIMPRPIFEYRDPATDLPIGSIFGLSARSTNPDVLLLIEARDHPDEGLRWEYAGARMTTSGVLLKLDEETVWDTPSIPNNENVQPNWTFYFLSRQLDVASE